MRIALGTDHSGFAMKSELIAYMESIGLTVIDHGSFTPERVDFPDIARLVGESLRSGEADRGIMLCGSGIGAAIAANKIPGIRACVCHDTYSAHQGVEHDDMNVLCIGGKIIGLWLAQEVVSAFVRAEFSKGDYFRRRLKKLDQLEWDYAKQLVERE
ncbi:ribose 5-phosphate isomerase B [Paenibacillus cremeus]|uniref:Ribose 5-phosphate isomerase B n=1 Tax=Paenibacillus cremeus TaxID=2163881 RepID=A0A559JFD0_9BACL|nr:ribose 5-phosphate isomerase B [Paenibacillus cremeus]TVX98582.1 ribose 5-phosphate isomerase B [Paenibacillus cremeus]